MKITQEHESFLKLEKIYIKEIVFSREFERPNWKDYDIEISVSAKDIEKDNLEIAVMLEFVKDELPSAVLKLNTVGIFYIENFESIPLDVVEGVIKTNTVAILFPFIRSQLALVTSQPDIEQVILPPLNVHELIKSINEEESNTKQKTKTKTRSKAKAKASE